MTSRLCREVAVMGWCGFRHRGKHWFLLILGAIFGAGVLAGGLLFFSGGSLGTPKSTLSTKGLSQNHLLFSPDGRYLVVAANVLSTDGNSPEYFAGELSVWDLTNGQLTRSIVTPQWIRSLSMTEKGDLLAVAIGAEQLPGVPNEGMPREVRLYSFPDMNEKGKLESKGFISCAALSPEGRFLATATKVAELKLWDTSDLALKRVLKGIGSATDCVRFSADGAVVAFNEWKAPPGAIRGGSVMIRQFHTRTGEPLKAIEIPNWDKPPNFLYLPDGKNMIVDCKGVAIYNTESGEATDLWPAPRAGNKSRGLAISKDGKWLLMTEYTKSIRVSQSEPHVIIIDLETKKVRNHWRWKSENPPGSPGPIGITSDKRKLAIGAEKVYLFDLDGN